MGAKMSSHLYRPIPALPFSGELGLNKKKKKIEEKAEEIHVTLGRRAWKIQGAMLGGRQVRRGGAAGCVVL